jgi:Histidinol-phosphate/aromatic aminotransferase and cobyric acid decarboxylase
MQAIILAAGMGKRLRHATSGKPKCMVEVNGVTLLERALANLTKFPLSRIVLVIGHRGGLIRERVGDGYGGVPVVYVENSDYETTNNVYSLYLARHILAEQDTLLLESDIIFEEAILEKLIDNPYPNVVVVDSYKPHMDGTVIKISPEMEVAAFIPKAHFDYKESDSYYKTVNIYKFSREFSTGAYIPFLESYCKVLGHNRFYEQVLRVILTLDQNNLRAMVLDREKWYEIDTLPDLRNAEALFADTPEKKLELVSKRYGGYWAFEGMLDFCYLVNPFFQPDRMLEEIRNSCAALLANYPAGQETQCLLAGELVQCHEKYLAVGNGAAELIGALAELVEGKIGIPYPTFMEYPARIAPERLVKIQTDDPQLRHDSETLKRAADSVDCMLLVNPDNPSGNFIPRSEVLGLAAHCRERGKRLIVDESFVDFAVDAGPHTLMTDGILAANPNLVVIRSISKTYGVPGVRLGILASADGKLIARARKAVTIWNINSFGEFFLQVGPKYAGEYAGACREMAAARDEMLAGLARIPYLAPLPSQANFILCKLDDGRGSLRLAEELLFFHNILVKSFSNREGLEGGEYVRFAVRTPEENRRLLDSLAEL